MDPPEPEGDELMMVTFWPNNPYYTRRARQRGCTVEQFVQERHGQIRSWRDRYGERFWLILGWETFKPRHWCQDDGSEVHFADGEEAFEFYRRWVGTSVHTLHWRDCEKFGEDRFNDRPGGMDFLRRQGDDPAGYNLVIGDTSASRVHNAFEAFPELSAFWWEGGITTLCVNVGTAFCRGAARQYDRRWILDLSPYSYPYPIHEARFYEDMGEWGGFEGGTAGQSRLNFPKYTPEGVRLAGYSPEILLRAWLTGLMGGCDVLFQEASCLSHFVKVGEELRLTPIGEQAVKLAAFNRRIADRGRPAVPVAVVLDDYHGVEPNDGDSRPWSHIEPTTAHQAIRAFFEAAWPGHSQHPPRPWKSPQEYGEMLRGGFDYRPFERRIVAAGRWADCMNVYTASAEPRIFEDSELLLILGPHDPKRFDGAKFLRLAREGRTIVCAAASGIGWDALPPESPAEPVERAFVVDLDGRRRAVAPYRLVTVEAGADWEVLCRSEADEPVLMRKAAGEGELWFCAAEAALDTRGEIFGPLLDLLDGRFAKLQGLPVSLEGPHGLQWSVNRTAGGWLALLVNHAAEPWWGEVVFRGGDVCDVRELWEDKSAVWQATEGGCRVRIGVAPFAAAVLGIEQDG
jgi:hypothetical protein